ncbi:hypothetical protein BVG00_23915 [Bacillus cereus]|nr:hypothetical protein BJG91_25895 [Bacillus thuringiensis]OPD41828.1 hypothetical protein BVG00_23915 [Bacillus cereus]OTY31256.1 hypothetical protein BK738_02650 [Bacillus thuringiensis serovar rongseni]
MNRKDKGYLVKFYSKRKHSYLKLYNCVPQLGILQHIDLSKKINAALFLLSNILFQCSAGSFKISVKMGEKHGDIKRTTFEILGLIGKLTDHLPMAS